MRSLVPTGSFARRMQSIFPPPDYLLMPAAGVDISNNSIKVLSMHHGDAHSGVRMFGSLPFNEKVIENGDILNKEAMDKALVTLRDKFRFSFVHASLPEKRAFIFQTYIPKELSHEEAHVVLESKLDEHVPLSAAEALFDFEAVPEITSEEGKFVSVSVYARRVVEDYVAALESAGFTVVSLEIESQAIARAVVPQGDPRTYLLVDFGKSSTKLAVASHGVIVYSSTVDIGGHSLTEAIMKYKNVSEEEADRIKNEQGFYQKSTDKELSEAMMSTVVALKDEINKRFLYWNERQLQSKTPLAPIEGVILCGGNANLQGFADFLGHSLTVPVEVANVWVNVLSFKNEIPPIDHARSLEYATALGLSLRGHLP